MRIRIIIGLFLSIAGIVLDIVREIADIWILRLIGFVLVLVGVVLAIPALSKGANTRKKAIIGLSLFITSILFTIVAEITDIWILGIIDGILMSAGLLIGIPALLAVEKNQKNAKNTDAPNQSVEDSKD